MDLFANVSLLPENYKHHMIKNFEIKYDKDFNRSYRYLASGQVCFISFTIKYMYMMYMLLIDHYN